MSRGIKHRAWQDNEMLYQKNDGIYETKRFIDKISEDCKLMQYTGLKDENGKEIYQDDIVKNLLNNKKAIIQYNFCSFILKYERMYEDEYLGGVSDREIEIIGNIYQNPELLKIKEIVT